MEPSGNSSPRKVMVVADPTRESAGALQYALSHVLVEKDELILIHVENNSAWKNPFATLLKRPVASSGSQPHSALSSSSNQTPSAWPSSSNQTPSAWPSSSNQTPSALSSSSSDGGAPGDGEVDFLAEMKHACEVAQPNLQVRVSKMQINANIRAAAILFLTNIPGIDFLVIGQRRSLSNAILQYKLPRRTSRGVRGMDTAEYLIENSKCTCVGVRRKGQNAGHLLNTKTQKNFWLLA